jgi:hypothetical protein
MQVFSKVVMGALVVGLSCHLALAASNKNQQCPLGNDEESFVFAGACFNGAPYRLHLFQNRVNGEVQSFYEYTGPVGQGIVQSDTPPKVMAVRVCRQQAEIINARYWE